MPIRIWKHIENQTNNRRKDSYTTLAHSEQIHSARRYLSTHFFVDLIRFMLKIIVDLTEILNSWLEIEILRNGHFGSLSYFDCAPASLCTTKLLVMACNFNWFIKITRSFGSGFQIKVVKPEARLIMTDNRSKQTFLPDQIRKHFWLWIADSTFHYLLLFFFSIVSFMFIMILTVALDFPGTQILSQQFPIPYAEATSIAACCRYGAMLTPGFFHFSASSWVENSIVPLRLVSRHRCAVLRFVLLSGVLKGISQVSLVVVLNRW